MYLVISLTYLGFRQTIYQNVPGSFSFQDDLVLFRIELNHTVPYCFHKYPHNIPVIGEVLQHKHIDLKFQRKKTELIVFA